MREIDCAVRDLIYTAFQTATDILTQARAILERGASAVLEKESIGEAELASLKKDLERIAGSRPVDATSSFRTQLAPTRPNICESADLTTPISA